MKRLITGVLLGSFWLMLLIYGSFSLFWLIITIGGAVALYEYMSMVFGDVEKRHVYSAILLGLFPQLSAYTGRPDILAASLFLAVICLAGYVLTHYASLEDAFKFISRAGFGILYVGFCLAHVTMIMSHPQGSYWLMILTSITVASDTGAYYTGRKFGKKKLCPAVSPGKTWAGLLGGLFWGGVCGVMVLAYLLPETDIITFSGIALALVVVGVMGDLLESVIKRSTGVKDSGQILAGHGGLLDRVDSLLLTAPVLYYLLYFNVMTKG